jgi:hypothetical protein
MATTACLVINGMNGYVPIYSNSKGGLVLGKAYNGKTVYWVSTAVDEFGYVQLDKRIVQDLSPEIKVSETGEYWIEKTHLQEAVVPPFEDCEEYELLGIYFKNGLPIVQVKKCA